MSIADAGLESAQRPTRFRLLSASFSIETLLIFMGAALILPSIGFIVFLVDRGIRQERAQIERRLQNEATALANIVDREIDRILTLLDTLSLSQRLKDRDYSGFHGSATTAVQRMKSTILVVDRDGRQIVNTRVPFGEPLPSPADTQSVAAVKSTGKPVVSNLIKGNVAKDWVFNIAMPVRRDGVVDEVLMMALGTEHLLGLMREQKLDEGWISGIVDRNGIVMARSIDHDRLVGKTMPPHLRADDTTGLKARPTRSVEGEKVLRSDAMSKRAGWSILVAVPQSLVDASVRNSQAYIGFAALMLLLLLLGLARLFARLLVDPMRALVKAAAAVGAPSEIVPLQSAVKEFNEVARVLQSASFELNARMRRLLVSEMRLNLAQKTAGMAYTDVDLTTGTLTSSETFPALFGYQPSHDAATMTEDFFQRIHADDRVRVRQTYELSRAAIGTFEVEYRFLLPGGPERWIKTQGQTIGDADGRLIRLIATSIDVTRGREQEDHIQFLMHEVVHRSKNMLSIVQSMATQTGRSSRDFSEFQAKFGKRLHAISVSHDILVAQDWQGADLATLISGQLESFVASEPQRLTLVGPVVFLEPQAAQSLGLAFHELATNAVKYGAFSTPDGGVRVSWDIDGQGEKRTLRLEWRETGGPPVSVPLRKGFGSTVFERMIGQALGAEITTTYDPGGVVWTFAAPFARIGDS